MGQQAVQSGNAHIIQAGDVIAKNLGGQGGLLCHRNVAGAAGRNYDPADAVWGGKLSHNTDPRLGVVGERVNSLDLRRFFRRKPGNKNDLLPTVLHGRSNAVDLLGGFFGAVNDLRSALPNLAM